MKTGKRTEFTGRHMALTMVGGFGIVAAVNFYMASLAVGGFHGIVVENSYVASQKFNEWISEADRIAQLGWTASAVRESDGRILITTSGVPSGAIVKADLRRPIGEHEFAELSFVALGDNLFRSTSTVSEGRWTARLSIEAGGEKWAEEIALK